MSMIPKHEKINILQDIAVANGLPHETPRRKTTSMLLFEEEPVYSDSEEEQEYIKKIYGSYTSSKKERIQEIGIQCRNSSPKENRTQEIGCQCDILTENKIPQGFLESLMKKCSGMNTYLSDDIHDLNDLCKILNQKFTEIARIQEKTVDSTLMDRDVNIANYQEIPLEFRPARCGSNTNSADWLRNNFQLMNPSQPEPDFPTSHKKEMTLYGDQIRSKDEKHPTKRFPKELVVQRRSSRDKKTPTNKYPMETVIGEQSVPEIPQSQKPARVKNLANHPVFNQDTNLSPEICPLKIALPSPIVKPLARNWMKPNKSFHGDRIVKRNSVMFRSLQNTKRRRLYSPSHFMNTDDYKNFLLKRSSSDEIL